MPFPVNRDTLNALYDLKLGKEAETAAFLKNRTLYKRYEALVDAELDVTFAGRLAT